MSISNSIVIGSGITCNKSNELVIGGHCEEIRVDISDEEHRILSNILKRWEGIKEQVCR